MNAYDTVAALARRIERRSHGRRFCDMTWQHVPTCMLLPLPLVWFGCAVSPATLHWLRNMVLNAFAVVLGAVTGYFTATLRHNDALVYCHRALHHTIAR
jgi:hypothetical protein